MPYYVPMLVARNNELFQHFHFAQQLYTENYHVLNYDSL